MIRAMAFLYEFTHSFKLYLSMVMVGAIEASNEREKTKNLLIYCAFFSLFIRCFLCIWMSKGIHDVLCAMAFNFLFNNWESKHIIIGLFEANYTSDVVMHVKQNYR
jgi:hypothetical protein